MLKEMPQHWRLHTEVSLQPQAGPGSPRARPTQLPSFLKAAARPGGGTMPLPVATQLTGLTPGLTLPASAGSGLLSDQPQPGAAGGPVVNTAAHWNEATVVLDAAAFVCLAQTLRPGWQGQWEVPLEVQASEASPTSADQQGSGGPTTLTSQQTSGAHTDPTGPQASGAPTSFRAQRRLVVLGSPLPRQRLSLRAKNAMFLEAGLLQRCRGGPARHEAGPAQAGGAAAAAAATAWRQAASPFVSSGFRADGGTSTAAPGHNSACKSHPEGSHTVPVAQRAAATPAAPSAGATTIPTEGSCLPPVAAHAAAVFPDDAAGASLQGQQESWSPSRPLEFPSDAAGQEATHNSGETGQVQQAPAHQQQGNLPASSAAPVQAGGHAAAQLLPSSTAGAALQQPAVPAPRLPPVRMQQLQRPRAATMQQLPTPAPRLPPVRARLPPGAAARPRLAPTAVAGPQERTADASAARDAPRPAGPALWLWQLGPHKLLVHSHSSCRLNRDLQHELYGPGAGQRPKQVCHACSPLVPPSASLDPSAGGRFTVACCALTNRDCGGPHVAWSPRHEHAQHPLVLSCRQVVLGLKLEYLDAVGREQLTAAELLEFWARAALLPDHDVLVSQRVYCRCLYMLPLLFDKLYSASRHSAEMSCCSCNVLHARCCWSSLVGSTSTGFGAQWHEPSLYPCLHRGLWHGLQVSSTCQCMLCMLTPAGYCPLQSTIGSQAALTTGGSHASAQENPAGAGAFQHRGPVCPAAQAADRCAANLEDPDSSAGHSRPVAPRPLPGTARARCCKHPPAACGESSWCET